MLDKQKFIFHELKKLRLYSVYLTFLSLVVTNDPASEL